MSIETTIKALTIFDANNKCMSVTECAKFLDVHTDTVRKHIRKGKIKSISLDGVERIPKIQFVDKIVNDFEKSE